MHDAEVGLIGAEDGTRRREGSPDPIAVGRVDARGQILEGDVGTYWEIPQLVPSLVHRERVVVDVPGPQGNSSCVDGKAQVVGSPHRRHLGLWLHVATFPQAVCFAGFMEPVLSGSIQSHLLPGGHSQLQALFSRASARSSNRSALIG